jgi:vitamin B12 transporter
MEQRKKKMLCSIISGAVLFGGASVALAEEAEQVYALDEVVVTASRIPTKLIETAANVTVVSRNDIEQKSLKTIAEALIQAGVNVEAAGGSVVDDAKIMLNGSEKVVILVDGRRVNWEQQVATGGRANYSLNMLPNMDSVERIEVVRGAASALYGNSSVGGVVNIITRKGEEKSTTASTEFGSWGSQRYRLQTGGKTGDTGYMVTAERWKQNNYEYKDPQTGQVVTMPNSDFERETASVRLDKDLGKGRILTFYFDHLDEDAGFPVTKPGYEKYSPDASRHIISNNVSLSYQWLQGEKVTNNLQAYRNHYSALFDRYMYNTSSSNFENEADGIEWNQTRILDDRHTLIGGFDWRNATVGVVQFGTTGSKMRNLGLFLEDRWTMDSQWTLSTGLRRDDHNVYGNHSTGQISLNRKVTDNTNMYLSWGQVYRGPDADDLFMPSSGQFRGNPNLKPEKGHTTTLGINTKLAGGTAIQASLFSTYLEDAIKWDYVNMPWEPVNVAEQKQRGLDLEVTHPLAPHWDLTAGYSYLQTKEDNHDGKGYQPDISNSNPNAYRLGVRFYRDAWNVSMMGRGATGRSLDAFTSKQYWVLDVAASYQIKPDVKVYAKVYNLTNRAYETFYASGWGNGAWPIASRQMVVGVEGRL